MVVVIGETQLGREIVTALAARGITATTPATLDEVRRRAVIVVVEGGQRQDPDVERAAGVIVVHGGSLVWLTTRPQSDPTIEAVRRKGIPYLIVHTGAIANLPERFGHRLVLIPSDLKPAPIALPSDLARAVAEAVAKDEVGTGRIVEVASGLDAHGWARTLRARGARCWVVPRWLATLLSWVGLLWLEVGTEGVELTSRRSRSSPPCLEANASMS